MKKIKLTRGQFALVDDEDYARISKYKWYATQKPFYARSTRSVLKKTLIMHRVIMKAKAGQQVDHINGNGLDNRRENLRLCTNGQNQMNSRKRRNGYKGICWHKKANKWQASLRINGRDKYLGLFQNARDAAKAYDKEARRIYKEFANLNFP